MNESTYKDVQAYKKITLITATVIMGLMVLFICLAIMLKQTSWLHPLVGLLTGTVLATINVAALGHAFQVIALENGSSKALLWPLSSFALMIAASLVLLSIDHDYLLGYALGLATPLILGAAVVRWAR